MSGRIYTAIESFSIEWEGKPLVVGLGLTAREGHPLLDAYPQFFTELVPDFEHVAPPKPAPKPAPKLRPVKVEELPKAEEATDDKE